MNKKKTTVNPEKINQPSNRFVNNTKPIVAFKITKYTLSLKDSSPYSSKRAMTD